MTTQTIARQNAEAMEPLTEVEDLGYFAAMMDLAAWEPGVTLWERRRLEARAAKYRDLQLEALERIGKS
jgi:hypothetical protein